MAENIQRVPCEQLPVAIQHAWKTVFGMPFENLTKIISYHEAGGDPTLALRERDQVIQHHCATRKLAARALDLMGR